MREIQPPVYFSMVVKAYSSRKTDFPLLPMARLIWAVEYFALVFDLDISAGLLPLQVNAYNTILVLSTHVARLIQFFTKSPYCFGTVVWIHTIRREKWVWSYLALIPLLSSFSGRSLYSPGQLDNSRNSALNDSSPRRDNRPSFCTVLLGSILIVIYSTAGFYTSVRVAPINVEKCLWKCLACNLDVKNWWCLCRWDDMIIKSGAKRTPRFGFILARQLII
jgi:hypothetical protein